MKNPPHGTLGTLELLGDRSLWHALESSSPNRRHFNIAQVCESMTFTPSQAVRLRSRVVRFPARSALHWGTRHQIRPPIKRVRLSLPTQSVFNSMADVFPVCHVLQITHSVVRLYRIFVIDHLAARTRPKKRSCDDNVHSFRSTSVAVVQHGLEVSILRQVQMQDAMPLSARLLLITPNTTKIRDTIDSFVPNNIFPCFVLKFFFGEGRIPSGHNVSPLSALWFRASEFALAGLLYYMTKAVLLKVVPLSFPQDQVA